MLECGTGSYNEGMAVGRLSSAIQKDLEDFYSANAYEGFSKDFNPDTFHAYASFVHGLIQNEELIEIGSGAGVAATCLHELGVRVTASDMYPELLQKNFKERNISIPILRLNVLAGEVARGSASNFSMYQVLEHIAEPQICIKACYDSLLPGGRLIIVSPNLLSPLSTGKILLLSMLGRWKNPWLSRRDGYSYPMGSTVLEMSLYFVRNFFSALLRPWVTTLQKPVFREPCLKKPASSDSDAVFLTEPITLRRMLQSTGFEIESYQQGRFGGSWAGSVWIAARKPKKLSAQP